MNNNYHTQIDKQNMLNEIAQNNHLLQQQSFQGTPVGKNQSQNQSQGQSQNPQSTQLMQQLYTQQAAQQATQNQLYNQQMNNNGNTGNTDLDDIEEIELSDLKPTQAPVPIPTSNPASKINNQIQQILPQATTPQAIQTVSTAQPLPIQPQSIPAHPLPPASITTDVKSNKPASNAMVEYVVIPILLIIVFIVLIHPKTSGMMDKYLPSINTTKGILVRAVILGMVYIIISFIANTMKKN